jgi:predicted pyridoxine 5'-phosphate oxidase superfamily flavin-nucleotide-binding protein
VTRVFHAGELELQRRAGVADEARAVGRIVARAISPAVARFLSHQRLAVASSVDARGRVWASLLAGAPGFLSVEDGDLRVASAWRPGDPLFDNLSHEGPLGLLAIDPRTRQRMRLNGAGRREPGGLVLHPRQVYGNCPKYIQLREAEPDATAAVAEPSVAKRLTSPQRERIARADTLFVASLHPEGADASHRGGLPGFVSVLGPTRLSFPDYPGNAMFNTLGNLLLNPKAGLLFVDFANGDVLQLTGSARVEADFTVVFEIDEAREARGASPLRYRLLEYSPANPALPRHTAAERGIRSSEPDEPEEAWRWARSWRAATWSLDAPSTPRRATKTS